MIVLDPFTKTLIGIGITLCIGISSGTVVLTHAVPDAWIPTVTAWAGIVAFVGSAVQTGLQYLGTTTDNRIAAAAHDPSVAKIVTTQALANGAAFSENTKVVSAP
jgi:hypothetical protein